MMSRSAGRADNGGRAARTALRGAVTALAGVALAGGGTAAAWAASGAPAPSPTAAEMTRMHGTISAAAAGVAALAESLGAPRLDAQASLPPEGPSAPVASAAAPVASAAAPVASADAPDGGPSGGTVAAQGACSTVVTQAVQPFQEHMRYAHIERPLEAQIDDISKTEEWVKTHTTLASTMALPVAEAAGSAPGAALHPFFEHFKYAHLERSPFGQIADIQDTGRWVATHQVLAETMASPATQAVGGCGAPQAPAANPMP